MLISSALHPLLGERVNGPIGKVVDVLTVSTLSALTGLGRGIRILSLANLGLCAALVLFVFISGPTSGLVGTFAKSIKGYGAHFLQMSFDTGGHTGDAWDRQWTFFFWAWWISWAPFVGTFIARISRGRTIRSVVLGVVAVPSVFSFVWFGVLGGTAVQRQRAGIADVAQAAEHSKSAATFEILGTLPVAAISSVVIVAVLGLLFITSADSASFTLGSTTSGGSQVPPKPLRLMWSFGAAFAAVLLLERHPRPACFGRGLGGAVRVDSGDLMCLAGERAGYRSSDGALAITLLAPSTEKQRVQRVGVADYKLSVLKPGCVYSSCGSELFVTLFQRRRVRFCGFGPGH